jgi:hypothetical protein
MMFLPGVRFEAGNPAVSTLETRSFPTPPHDGCGFISFLILLRSNIYQKAGPALKGGNNLSVQLLKGTMQPFPIINKHQKRPHVKYNLPPPLIFLNHY